MVGWGNWMIGERSEDFLIYCCWRQVKGTWNFGMFFKTPNQEVLPIWKGKVYNYYVKKRLIF